MCWAGISATGLLALVWIEGNLGADWYIALLERHVIDFIDDDWLFQQDNAPAHVSERTKAFFSADGVQLLRWPANCPDLNPVANLWGIFTRSDYRDKPAYDFFSIYSTMP